MPTRWIDWTTGKIQEFFRGGPRWKSGALLPEERAVGQGSPPVDHDRQRRCVSFRSPVRLLVHDRDNRVRQHRGRTGFHAVRVEYQQAAAWELGGRSLKPNATAPTISHHTEHITRGLIIAEAEGLSTTLHRERAGPTRSPATPGHTPAFRLAARRQDSAPNGATSSSPRRSGTSTRLGGARRRRRKNRIY